jgi:hypothetical protein
MCVCVFVRASSHAKTTQTGLTAEAPADANAKWWAYIAAFASQCHMQGYNMVADVCGWGG